MEAERWARVAELFDRVADLPTAERDALLSDEAGADVALRREVEALLAAHDSPGPLDRPVVTRPSGAARAPLRQRLERALDGRYALVGELGRGGMGTVFLAHEGKHGRNVALKVLDPDVAAACGAERFLREIQLSARLSHPHIIGLIDSGEADGLLWYAMPYLEGETLRARIDRDGLIPLAGALRVLRDVADALAHAHRNGVVHRDLKPENVLCVAGHAYLLDFGIAKVLRRAREDLSTAEGIIVGTPEYMAPEQVAGTGLDQRADIYAWGLLAHELLIGRRAAQDRPIGAGELVTGRPGVPASLAALVARCLARDPERRPADAGEIVALLDGLVLDGRVRPRGERPGAIAVAGVVLLLVLAGVLGVAVMRSSSATGSGMGPGADGSVAVAAFRNETGDSSLAIWGRMAGDWLTQGLQETGLVRVVPWPSALRASMRALAEQGGDPVRALYDEAGAATVVTGAYYLVGDSLRFQVEVTDARAGRVLGTLPPVTVARDAPQSAIELVRERLMGSVAIWRDERFSTVPGSGVRPPTYAAYRAFDRASQRFQDQEYAAALEGFREAVALDTSFALALVHAATAAWNADRFAAADSFVRLASARRDELTEYHRLWLDELEALLVGDRARALTAIRRAVEIAPEARASYNLAFNALQLDRPEEARHALERLDPDRGDMRDWSSYWTQLSHARHLLGDHEGDLAAARALRNRFPDRRVGWVLEMRALAAAGRIGALDSLLDAARGLPPSVYWSQGAMLVTAGEEITAHGAPALGRRFLEQAVDWLRTQRLVDSTVTAHRYWLGSALYNLGRWEEAAREFEGLAAAEPDRLDYRGLAALAASRLGRPDAASLLDDHHPRERGEVAMFRGRLAAARGDVAEAASRFREAVGLGVPGLPWLHASAVRDLAPLQAEGAELPRSLTAARP